ncbi:hypothetical protein C7C56_026565 [Massilia glaciei]|uniref:Transposase IS4-like domain-containing protein n=2 Tax=Massilia glaciei TaxID=1524097 RepID=A0A2U2HA23_9BURK|nr:hypothetical protein C7C56_026565 [Massilia glaciei]
MLDMKAFPASSFRDLYHQRWRIEEAFKRLKDRLSIEHVTGLSQQAVVQDVSAKIVTDNLQALTALTAHVHAGLDIVNRINHAYAHSVLKPLWPSLLTLGRKVKKLLKNALELIGGQNYRHRENVSKPRKAKAKAKSYKHLTQKPC